MRPPPRSASPPDTGRQRTLGGDDHHLQLMQRPVPLQVLHWLVSENPRNLPVPPHVLQRAEPPQLGHALGAPAEDDCP